MRQSQGATGWSLRPRQASAAAFRLALIPGIICHGFAAFQTGYRVSIGMLRLESIVGLATDAALAQRLHHLEHDGKVEYIHLAGEDTARRRLRVATDRGTDCAILLRRSDRLANGAVLLLERDRAIVVRLKEEAWLALAPRDAAAALELGYFAGNMHWPVRFNGSILRIALHGPVQSYLERLDHLLKDGRIRRADHE